MAIGYEVQQASLFGHARAVSFGDDAFRVADIPRAEACDIIKRNHYSGTVFPNSTEHHSVSIGGRLVGVLQWGSGMNPASGPGVVRDTKPDEWLELNRMWLDDDAPRNSESRAISYSVKLLRRQRPEVGWVQSFADERCGGALGVVYQACSFLFLGEHMADFYLLDGKWYHKIAATCRGESLAERPAAQHLQANLDRAEVHTFRQFRYWRPLRNWARGRLLLTPQPYPKREAAPCG